MKDSKIERNNIETNTISESQNVLVQATPKEIVKPTEPVVEEIDQLVVIEQAYQNKINLITDLVNLKNNLNTPDYKKDLPTIVGSQNITFEEPKLTFNYVVLNSKNKYKLKDRSTFELLLEKERSILAETFKDNDYNIEDYSISRLPILHIDEAKALGSELLQFANKTRSIQFEIQNYEKNLIKGYFDRVGMMDGMRKLDFKIKESKARYGEVNKKLEDKFSNYY
jgi:hypothetical protein